MSQTPSPKQLYSAILANSATLVKEYLKAGIDPNVQLASSAPMIDSLVEDTDEDGTGFPQGEKVARVSSSQVGALAPLHVAIINAYHSHNAHEIATKIIRLLLDSGANPSAKTCNMAVCNIAGYNWLDVDDDSTPCDLAVLLKQHLRVYEGKAQAKSLDNAINTISQFTDTPGNAKLPTSRIPKAVVKTWKSLLFSPNFSDVKFICDDDTTLHAHKCVLAAASPYFSAAFSGPWAENNPDGVFRTSNSSEIMKAVLSFVYTGKVNSALIDSDPMAVLSVSSEYSLDALRTLAEASCIRTLSTRNVKEMLQLAHLHSSATLKEACFVFVKRHACDVLTNPTMMSLMTEDPELWGELTAAIGDGGDRRVRQRTE